METILGVTFNDFVILATDMTEAFSIIKLQEESNKIYQLGSHLAMAIAGEPGDNTQFAEFVQRNMELEKFRDGFEVTPDKAFHWTRYQLAQSIRSRNPYNVFPLIAAFDAKQERSRLFYLDYLGSGCEVVYIAHGYGESFSTGFLDRYHRPSMTQEQGIDLVKGALSVIQNRLIVGQDRFQMAIIDKDGLRPLPHFVKVKG